jgi:chitodextrinase
MLSAQARCGSGLVTVTAQMGSVRGREVRFYDANGALLSIATNEPFIYSTFISSGSQTIFASSALPGCESERTSITAFSGSVPSAPQAENFERCGGGALVTLTAFMGAAPGNEIRLYNTEQGGSIVAIATNEPYLLTIPSVVTGRTVTYYMSSVINTQEGSCESRRAPVTVTLNNIVTPPTVRSENRCGEGSVVFTVSHANSPGTEVRLYTQLSGTAPIRVERGQNLFMTSPPITSVTTFYFSTFANGCESERTSVVTAAVPTPGVPASQDIYLCGAGSATFTVAPGTVPGTEYHLYNAEESTVPIAIATQPPYRLTVPSVSASSTYYIQAVNNSSFGRCSSARVAVRAIIGQALSAAPIPSLTACGAGSFTFNLNPENIQGAEVRVYNSRQASPPISVLTQSPYNFVTPQLTTSTTYYYSIAVGNCQSGRDSFEASVIPIPQAPAVSASVGSLCGAGQVTLTLQANQSNVTAMRLYDSAGNRLETFSATTAFYTVNITTTTSFFAAAVNGNCEGPRERITILSSRTPSPAPRNFAVCAGETVAFTIDDATPNREYRLYPDRNNPFVVAVANLAPYTITTPSIQTNTTFYLTNFDNNCESERVPVVVTTTSSPATPVVRRQNRCGAGPVTITAAMGAIAGTSMRLYDAAIGGNLVSESFAFPYTFIVSPPIGTFTYYVSASSGKCESARVSVTVTAGQEPSSPSVQSLSRCGVGAFTFTAQMGTVAGDAIRVYETQQSDAPVATISSAPYLFTTPVLSSSATYFFASVIGGCESPRVAAVGSVTSQPSAPLVSAVPACGSERVVTFTVNSGSIAGEVYRLYTTPGGSSAPIVVAPSSQNFITVNNPVAATYYISAANGNCESERVAVSRALGNPPIISFSTQAETCSNFGSVSASASGGSGSYNFELYRGDNLISSSRTGQFLSVTGGAYRLVVRDNNGCFAEVNATVAGILSPVFTANADVTSSSATINWSAVPGVQGYIVQYRSLPTGTFITLPPINADQTGVTISGLQANTLYEARVQAVCTGGRFSDYSNALAFQTSVAAISCNAPAGLSALATGTSANLSWGAVSGAVAYNIIYQRLPDGLPQQANNVATNSFSVQGLAPNAEYLFQVQAVCGGGVSSAFSAGQSFVTRGAATACAVPQNIRGEVGITDILVAWNSVAGAVSYTLQYRELPNGAPFFINGITSTSQLITGLAAEKSYEARIRANCGDGVSSEYSSGAIFVTNAAGSGSCGIPSGFGVQFRAGNVAILSWQPVNNALCYVVSVGVKGESPDTWIDYLVPAPATSLEVFNLIPGREYSARIRSNCSLCSIRTGLRSSFSGVLDFRMAATRSSLENPDLLNVEAYPNPTTGLVQISFPTFLGGEAIHWEAIDVNGKALLNGVWEPNVEGNLLQLDLSPLSSGVYILKLKSLEKTLPLRIIKN